LFAALEVATTHKHAEVRAWLAKLETSGSGCTSRRPSCSWLNLVECFSVITRQAIRRGTFTSVTGLTAAIGAFIDDWNDQPHPFTWTKGRGRDPGQDRTRES
jgi:hypothetical protein